ncbi:MAG: heme-binding protein [Myxococcota bacterium]
MNTRRTDEARTGPSAARRRRHEEDDAAAGRPERRSDEEERPRATLSTEAIETLLSTAIARARELGIALRRVRSRRRDRRLRQLRGRPAHRGNDDNQGLHHAVQTGMPTKDWKAYLDGIPADELKIIDKIDGYIAADGGYPIVENGLVLGGIGVSGADQQRDTDVALRAMAALDA